MLERRVIRAVLRGSVEVNPMLLGGILTHLV
jgi:hypothetical protein